MSKHTEEQSIPVIAEPEPALVRIAKAMQSLTRAIPGVHMINMSSEKNRRAVSITANTDDDVRALAAALGVVARDVVFEDTHWVDASYHRDDVMIFISGPQVPVTAPPAIAESAIAAALAEAEAAL